MEQQPARKLGAVIGLWFSSTCNLLTFSLFVSLGALRTVPPLMLPII